MDAFQNTCSIHLLSLSNTGLFHIGEAEINSTLKTKQNLFIEYKNVYTVACQVVPVHVFLWQNWLAFESYLSQLVVLFWHVLLACP